MVKKYRLGTSIKACTTERYLSYTKRPNKGERVKEERLARKKLKKAAKKRAQRKTLYPFGFEYRSNRK